MRQVEGTKKVALVSEAGDPQGIIRHEIGQQLCSARSWMKQPELLKTFQTERGALVHNLNLPKEVRRWASFNRAGEEYAFEQVTTDFYALEHGGLGMPNVIKNYLQEYFPETLRHLIDLTEDETSRLYAIPKELFDGDVSEEEKDEDLNSEKGS